MTESRAPAIIGFLIAGVIILALGFFGDRIGGRGEESLPALRISAPADGDSVRNPVIVRFTTDAALELHPGMGWMAGDLHLHAMVDGREVMPAAADIRAADGGWEWQLTPLEPGLRQLHLTWAGRHHGNLDSATDTIRFHVAP